MEQTFGQLLRERRRAAGMSQRDLAQQSHLDFSYISKLENDRLPPPAADTVVQLCHILQIPPEELLAVIGKIPSEVQHTVSSSPAAQEFLREAQRHSLSEKQWKRMVDILRNLPEEHE